PYRVPRQALSLDLVDDPRGPVHQRHPVVGLASAAAGLAPPPLPRSRGLPCGNPAGPVLLLRVNVGDQLELLVTRIGPPLALGPRRARAAPAPPLLLYPDPPDRLFGRGDRRPLDAIGAQVDAGHCGRRAAGVGEGAVDGCPREG